MGLLSFITRTLLRYPSIETELAEETRAAMRRNSQLLEEMLARWPQEDDEEPPVRIVKAVRVHPKRRRA